MTIYAWPSNWFPSRFEMRVMPNTRIFTGPYTPTVQVLDLLGERWQASIELAADNDPILGAAREAFSDRLKGPANLISMSYLRRPLPQGTLRNGASAVQWKTSGGVNANWTGSGGAATWQSSGPSLAASVAQLSNVLPISTTAGKSLFAGDHIGVGVQLFRVMAPATADVNGLLSVEVQPRARTTLPAGAAVNCTSPTANFMLKADGIPTVWRPGMFEGASLDLIEVF
jgi:hypothetical protein